MEIILKFSRQDFEEIYLGKGQDRVFPEIRVEFIGCLLILPVLIALDLFKSIIPYAHIYFSIFIFIPFVLLIRIYYKAKPIIDWKRSVHVHLKHMEQIKSHKLIITPTSLIYQQDHTETIFHWGDIYLLEIKETYLQIETPKSNLILPTGSMSGHEFNKLCETVKGKVRSH